MCVHQVSTRSGNSGALPFGGTCAEIANTSSAGGRLQKPSVPTPPLNTEGLKKHLVYKPWTSHSLANDARVVW